MLVVCDPTTLLKQITGELAEQGTYKLWVAQGE